MNRKQFVPSLGTSSSKEDVMLYCAIMSEKLDQVHLLFKKQLEAKATRPQGLAVISASDFQRCLNLHRTNLVRLVVPLLSSFKYHDASDASVLLADFHDSVSRIPQVLEEANWWPWWIISIYQEHAIIAEQLKVHICDIALRAYDNED